MCGCSCCETIGIQQQVVSIIGESRSLTLLHLVHLEGIRAGGGHRLTISGTVLDHQWGVEIAAAGRLLAKGTGIDRLTGPKTVEGDHHLATGISAHQYVNVPPATHHADLETITS
jgi:hypothetical protein